jgi:hypothetical protein
MRAFLRDEPRRHPSPGVSAFAANDGWDRVTPAVEGDWFCWTAWLALVVFLTGVKRVAVIGTTR